MDPKYKIGEIVLFNREKGFFNRRNVLSQGRIAQAEYIDNGWEYCISYDITSTSIEDNIKESVIVSSLGFPIYADSTQFKIVSNGKTSYIQAYNIQ